jgi:hypothetical protein
VAAAEAPDEFNAFPRQGVYSSINWWCKGRFNDC